MSIVNYTEPLKRVAHSSFKFFLSKKLCLQLNLHTHFKAQLMRYGQHVGDRPTCFVTLFLQMFLLVVTQSHDLNLTKGLAI